MKTKTVLISICLMFAFGAANAQKIQTTKLGKTKVHTISESQSEGSVKILIQAKPSIIEKYAPNGTFPNAVNAFLIQKDGLNILVDAGLGEGIIKGLKQLKVNPRDIHIILLTHMHGDHIGALLLGDTLSFPNAKLYFSKAEYDYWIGPDAKNQKAKAVIDAYERQLYLFDPADITKETDDLIPDIKAFAAFGHTPGHTIYLLENGKEDLLIWGDLTHAMAVQMPHPEIGVTYDHDPKEAIESRKKVLDYVIKNNLKIAGMHVPFPAIGSVKKEEQGYSFKPLKK